VAHGAPALVRLSTQVAPRFGILVTQKMLARAASIIGAAAGAAINVGFMKHFQDAARGRFTVLRLKAAYGAYELA
jgi:hypothetical protein